MAVESFQNFKKPGIEVTIQDVNFINGVGEGQAILGFKFTPEEVKKKVEVYMAQGMTKMQAIEKIKEEREIVRGKQRRAA